MEYMSYKDAQRIGISHFKFLGQIILDENRTNYLKEELKLNGYELNNLKDFISWGILIGIVKENDKRHAYFLCYRKHNPVFNDLKSEILLMIKNHWKDDDISQAITMWTKGKI